MRETYRLYIDESGDHKYHDYSIPKYDDPAIRYLGLMGVAIEREAYKKIHAELESLKQEFFKFDPDDPIIFHRKDIMHKKGPYKVFQDPETEKAFGHDLIDFIETNNYVLFLVVVDKKALGEKHGPAAFHPYHYALRAMLERYCGYLNFWSDRGDVMAEGRGKNENRELKRAYSYLYENGTYYHTSSFFQRALTSKEIKIKPKKANIAGLQMADILAHPCKQGYLFEKGRIPQPAATFGATICKYANRKYNVQVYQQRAEGYGKVFLG